MNALSGFGRPAPDEPSSPEARLMERRLDLLLGVFARASTACGIKFAEGASIPDCADQIIRAAKGAKLDARLYEIMWKIRKWANPIAR
jgi:hypothetical protein